MLYILSLYQIRIHGQKKGEGGVAEQNIERKKRTRRQQERKHAKRRKRACTRTKRRQQAGQRTEVWSRRRKNGM